MLACAALANLLACESSTAPGDAAVAPLLATASLAFVIPNAADVGLTILPRTLPRAIDPEQCAFDSSSQVFLCSPYSISISQVFTGFSDTLSYELLDASGARMRAFDAALTTTVSTLAAVEYVTQFQGTQLPGDLHQALTLRLNGDGSSVIDGTETIHASSVAYRGPIYYKTGTMNVTISAVIIPARNLPNRFPLSGTVRFESPGYRVSTVTFNGTQFVSVKGSDLLTGLFNCTLALASSGSTALACGKDAGAPIAASRGRT